MKRFLSTIGLSLVTCALFAQSIVTNGEYFIDLDPGLGNGVPFTLAPGQDVSRNLTIDVDTLSNNLHNIYFRVQDVYRNWSLSTVKPFLKITPSNQQIDKAEYFIDNDPGFGNAIDIPIVADSNLTINTFVDLSLVSSGLHVFYCRVKNQQGFWSITEIRPFIKAENSNTPITDIEYFWDNDPGDGNGIPISFTSSNNVSVTFNPSYTSLIDGFHILYVRVKNQNNFWSLTNSRPFLKLTDPTSNIQEIEYFWDNDPGEGLGNSVAFTADTNVSVLIPADISSIPDGFHNFYIRVRNALGFWSLTSVRPIFKVSDANSNIAEAEYFIDNDPGFGNATSIILDSLVTDLTQGFLVDLSNISGGIHTIYIRVRNADGLWSLTHNRPFLKVSGSADIVSLEYFFDNDPGHGNGLSIPLGSVQDTAWTGVIDLTSIPQGYHRLYVRAKAADGSFSLTNSDRFAWCNGPQINITPSSDTLCLGATVTFIDSTINLNATTKYEWDFDSDGVIDDTTIGSVSFRYLDTGTYYATLRAINFDTCYDSVGVRIVVLPQPVASFVADTACHTFLTSFSDSTIGVLPLNYAWDFDNDFIGDSATIGNVQNVFPSPGIFPVNLMIDMGYGCLDTFTADIVVKTQPFPAFSAPGNCLGLTTFITDLSSGLLPASTYAWDINGNGNINDTTTGDISLIYQDTGLYAVSLIIDNLNGCVDTSSRNVKIHGLPGINASSTSPVCFGGFDGQATANVVGDPTKYTYRWSDDNKQTSQTAIGLYARRYFVSVVDSNGCFNRDTVDVLNPPKIDLSVVTTDAICGQNTGSATLSINSGLAPYEFYWTSGDTTLQTSNLAAGIYIASVTDAEGCNNSIPALINNTNAPSVTINNITDVSCFGLEDGAIDVSISGGATPYQIEWANQATTEDIANLEPGPYEVMVMGADSCLSFARGIVGEPDPIIVDVQGFESLCFGSSAGSAIASAVGGTGTLNYVWSTGGIGPNISNLAAGVYHVDVTDANACSERGYVAISDTGSAKLFIDSLIDVTCGQVNGGVYIKVLSVRGTPSFLWEDGDTNEDHENVDIGLHYVEVSDSTSCKSFAYGVLVNIAPIPNPICVTTVDSQTNHIYVGWERLVNPAVESYNVYKETTVAGTYFHVGNVPFNSPGVFIDSFSNPSSRWWKYKITVLDSCGNESDINAVAAAAHKTMQLNARVNATADTAFLIWDEYIGFSYPKYYIYRYTDLDGYNLIDSVNVPKKTYKDVNFPQSPLPDTLMYWVIAKNALGCDPSKDPDYNRTRSNPSMVNPELLNLEWIEEDRSFSLFPIPAKAKLYMRHSDENVKMTEIRIKTINGSEVYYTKNYNKDKGIDIEKLSAGVYFIDFHLDDQLKHKKFIKE